MLLLVVYKKNTHKLISNLNISFDCKHVNMNYTVNINVLFFIKKKRYDIIVYFINKYLTFEYIKNIKNIKLITCYLFYLLAI